jgi:hypothetical protein
LKDGDKISNGKEILIFNKGKFYLEKWKNSKHYV